MTTYNDFFLNEMLDENLQNRYENVYLHTGSNCKIEWNSCLAYNTKIIKQSNSFIGEYFTFEPWYRDFQNNSYKIFDNLNKNLNELLNVNNQQLQNTSNIFNNNEIYFLMINSFTFKNYGHDFSVILDQLNYIINNNIKNVIIYEDYKNNNNFKLITHLIPTDVIFFEIKYNTIYFIKNIIIINPVISNIYLHKTLIDQIIQHINNIYLDKYKDCIDKNVIIMKTNRNDHCFVNHNNHKCELFLLELEKQHWINIIPEKMDIYKMVIMLNHAKNIITSEGCISFLNHIFFNKNATVIYIGKNKLYISITMKNSNNYCYINDTLNEPLNPYLDYINIINLKINKKDYCYDMVAKPCVLSKIIQNHNVINILNCNYCYYSNKTDFIKSHKLLHAHCFITDDNIAYIPDREFGFYVENFIRRDKLTLIKNKIKPILLDKAYILYHTLDNAGHTLGLILYAILKYMEGDYKCKLIVTINLLNLSIFIKSIIHLFINKEDIILMDENTNYYIKNCYVNDAKYHYDVVNTVSSYCYNEQNNTSECVINENDIDKTKHSNEINLLINKLKLFDDLVEKQPCLKKICLIKMDHDNNFSKNRHFDESYKHFFINNGFEIINPSNFSAKELYVLLKNAKQVILSWGCNSWINRLFIESRTHAIILCHEGYKHEYTGIKTKTNLYFSPNCNKTTYVYDLNNSINEININLLTNIINN